mgnify:CR=1 FL=1
MNVAAALLAASAVFGAAATACKQTRDEVLATGDMNEYLASSEAIRTPRLSMLRKEGPYFWLAILLGYEGERHDGESTKKIRFFEAAEAKAVELGVSRKGGSGPLVVFSRLRELR